MIDYEEEGRLARLDYAKDPPILPTYAKELLTFPLIGFLYAHWLTREIADRDTRLRSKLAFHKGWMRKIQ